MLAGHVKGRKRSLSSMFEAVGSYAAGTMTEEDVCEFEEQGMSDLWFLFRYVYSKQHELPDRGSGYGTSEETERFRPYILQESSLQNMQVCRSWSW